MLEGARESEREREGERERDPLGMLRALVSAHAPAEGHTALDPLCVYRFSRATRFTKTPAFGVTLGVVLSGTKQLRIEGDLVHIDGTRLVVITREVAFEFAAAPGDRGEPYLGMSLCFSPESVARALVSLADAGGSAPRETTAAFVTDVDGDVVDALVRIARSLGDPLERRVLVPLAVEEILFRLLRSEAAAAVRAAVGSAPDSAKILEAMRAIRAESDRALDVPTLARRVGMSPSHFAHRFRAVARTTPMRFVREVRLERARTLLGDPGSRASDVASRVGFASASHFTREFKRRFGVPPSHYQRRA
jgi:AraC-like DNA-binding protein